MGASPDHGILGRGITGSPRKKLKSQQILVNARTVALQLHLADVAEKLLAL
jgi:hypothetical protein